MPDLIALTAALNSWRAGFRGKPAQSADQELMAALDGTTPQPAEDTRIVTIEGPGGVRYDIPISGDQTVTFSVDGNPAAGVDARGLGCWPDGENWLRLGGLNPRIVDPADEQSSHRSDLLAVTLLGVDLYVQRTDTRTVVFLGDDDVPEQFGPVVIQVDPSAHIEVENLY